MSLKRDSERERERESERERERERDLAIKGEEGESNFAKRPPRVVRM